VSRATGDELRVLIRSGWRVIAFETFEEDRALSILEKAAERCERACLRWSLASGLGEEADEVGPGAGSLDAGLQAIARFEAPAVFAVLDAHRLLGDALAVRRLRDLMPAFAERRQTLVLMAPVLDLPLELLREAGRIELPLPAAAELRGLFARLLEQGSGQPPEPETLDEAVRGALGLTSAEAVRVLRKACRATGGLNDAAVREIVRDKRRALRRTPALSFHEDQSSLETVGGLGELKRWLAERRRAFGDDARRFGLPTPRGLLLLGVQGCGKSLCAKAVAREWQFPLLRLDLAAAFGSTSQSPETAIREAIQVAESLAPAVLWIDEIEKGFSASSADSSSSRVFGAFLTWLSEKQSPVFVVATANDISGLPPELLRRGRFDELFFVDLPTPRERAEILSIHLARHSRDPLQYDLDDLAAQAERLTGAELEQAVTAALYTAFAAGREVSDADLANAITETVPIYDTYEERIKELRDWARTRARPASLDARMVDLFRSA
jgi:SpoVK/Ycf46/Vps4 family AAA+-type ATPase